MPGRLPYLVREHRAAKLLQVDEVGAVENPEKGKDLKSDASRQDSATASFASPPGPREGVAAHLMRVGERREVRLGGIRFAGRRRRPVGSGAPLPREL